MLGAAAVQWIPVSNFRDHAGGRGRGAAARDGPAADRGRGDPRAAGRGVPARRRRSQWVEREIRGWDLRYAAYPVDGLAVWGMTARVLGGLGRLARPGRREPTRAARPRPRPRGGGGAGPLRSARRPSPLVTGRRRGASPGLDPHEVALDDPRQRQRGPRELDDDRAHLGAVGPRRVEHVRRPGHGLARLDPRPLVADADPAAALDHDEPGAVGVGVRRDPAARARTRARRSRRPGRSR